MTSRAVRGERRAKGPGPWRRMSARHGAEGEVGGRQQVVQRSRADIPPIDVEVLKDLELLTQDVSLKVDQMMKSLNGTIQNMTALSVGYIQTYRDSVDSLGESVDMSIKVGGPGKAGFGDPGCRICSVTSSSRTRHTDL
ncbi:BLOC-1-related complex subunit 6 [Lithobates pipiens]